MGHWLGYPTRETSSPCRLRGFSEGLLLLLLLHYFLCFSFSFLFLLLVSSSFSSSPTLDFFILSPAFLFLSFSLSFFHMYLFPFLLSPTFFPHKSAARMMWCLPRMPGLAPGRPRGGPGASSCALGPRNCPGLAPAWSRSLVNGAGVASVPFRVFVGRLAWKPRAFGWPRRGSRDKLSVACYRAHPVMRERASRGRIMMARVIRAGGR